MLGRNPESIAILATWGKGVKIISHALRESNGNHEISHRVQFDETATYLSSRIIAFLLEPKFDHSVFVHTAEALVLMANLHRAKGQRTDWERYERWSVVVRTGAIPTRSTVVPEIFRIVEEVSNTILVGDPEKDWLMVKNLLLSSPVKAVSDIGKSAEYLMAFNRGRLISKGLSRKWEERGSYVGARAVLDTAIVETQIASENRSQKGINVMTIHKAKGKEFDGVIIFDNAHSSPFIVRGDQGLYMRSRRLLLVGVTRAKHHAMILRDVTETCPIIGRFRL